MITEAILSKIAPSLKGERLAKYANGLDKICPQYGINSADIMHEFLSNCLHESHEFTTLEEGMNYQSIALQKLFSRKRISMGDTINYGRTKTHAANKVMIANTIYGGEWGRINLGNVNPMDGWIFRGGSPIQITGRGNVTRFTNYYNAKTGSNYTPEQMADLLKVDIEIGIHCACWIFAISFKLIDEAIDDKMNEVVKKINGGYIGMPDRLKYYELCKKYIV